MLKKIKGFYNSLNQKNKKRIELIKFFTLLIILASPVYFIMQSDISFYSIEENIAKLTVWGLNQTGINATLGIGYEKIGMEMPIIILQNFEKPIGIARACTGYRSILALTALILATPKIKWKKKLRGILLFAPLLFMLNIVRVYTSVLIAELFGEKWFEIAHTILWREGLIALILILWTLWLLNEKGKLKQTIKKVKSLL